MSDTTTEKVRAGWAKLAPILRHAPRLADAATAAAADPDIRTALDASTGVAARQMLRGLAALVRQSADLLDGLAAE